MRSDAVGGSNGGRTIGRRTILKSAAGIASIAYGLTWSKPVNAYDARDYDYPKKYLWDVKRVWNIGEQLRTMRERMPQAGSAKFDLDRLINSAMGESLVVMFENFNQGMADI